MALETQSPWRQAIRGVAPRMPTPAPVARAPQPPRDPHPHLPKEVLQSGQQEWPGGYEALRQAWERGYAQGRAEAREALGLRARDVRQKTVEHREVEIALSQMAQAAAALLHETGDCQAATALILALVVANRCLGGENKWAPPDIDERQVARERVAFAEKRLAELEAQHAW